MCQLIYVNSRNQFLNRLLVLNQTLEDTTLTNKDGWGIFHPDNGMVKFHICPWDTKEYHKYVKAKVTGVSPIIAHVRMATKGSEIKTVYNHPFTTGDITLAHNGTLEPKDSFKESYNAYKDLIDSQIFLEELVKQSRKDGDIPGDVGMLESMKKTMDNFTGKFAFLIHNRGKGNFYAFRGRTADLHISYLSLGDKRIGYVINTRKDDLCVSMSRTAEMYGILKDEILDWTDPELLKENTGFVLGKTEIFELGSLVQNDRPYVAPPVRVWNNGVWEEGPAKPVVKSAESELGGKSRGLDLLKTLTQKYGLLLEEIDDLFYYATGYPLLAVDNTDIDSFVEHIMPRFGMSKKNRKVIVGLLKGLSYDQRMDVYEKGPFQFPYMLEKQGLSRFVSALREEVLEEDAA